MSYLKVYDDLLCKVNDHFENAIIEMTKLLQCIEKPIEFGNMVYSTCNDEYGIIVPAYCYKDDFIKGNDFKPIYDRYENCYYGWYKKEDVLRIFDALKDYIERNYPNKITMLKLC